MIMYALMVYHITYKEDFIDWILDFEEYFNNKKILESFKVQFVSSKLESDAEDWWNDIEYFRMCRDKSTISSWPRKKKKMMVKFLFTCDFDEILFYESKSLGNKFVLFAY